MAEARARNPKAPPTVATAKLVASGHQPFTHGLLRGPAPPDHTRRRSLVRSAYGPSNPWFRRAKESGGGRIRAGGVERDVTFAEADADAHATIDEAYHAKYDRYGPRLVGTVVGPEVEAVTIKLVPRSTNA